MYDVKMYEKKLFSKRKKKKKPDQIGMLIVNITNISICLTKDFDKLSMLV
jgi:hypothetical protein